MILLSTPKLNITIKTKDSMDFFFEEWSGYIKSELFRELLLKSIDVYKENAGKIEMKDHKLLLLADASKMDLIKNDDMEWLANNVNPLYEECGFTHQAVIMPERFFGQQSVKNYEELSKSGNMLTNVFHTEEKALKWFANSTTIPATVNNL